jgi:hypothetical protein
VWAPDGKELFYTTAASLFRVTVKTGRGFDFSSAASIPRPFENFGPTVPRVYDMMPDGQRLIGIVSSGQRQGDALTQINVVLTWHEELKQLVPLEK